MLRDRYKVIVQTDWRDSAAAAVIALHARRSAASIEAYRAGCPGAPLAVVLTGTDLYRDLPESAEAARSLDAADRVVVLQDDALRLLQPRWRQKARVIFQSATPLATRRKANGELRCVAVGHLREEKDPATLYRAVEALSPQLPIRVRHIGAALDAALADDARRLQQRSPIYRYSGALPHGLVRSAIANAHVLVHPSRMEGGANVIVEAIASGTPVIASRISGNVGMLGADYPGFFPVGDARALAGLLVRALQERPFLRSLKAACARRKPLFSPRAERDALRQLVADLLQ